MNQVSEDVITKVKTALNQLDSNMISIDGVLLKPSQCYHIGTDPAHVLFNTNCPDDLKKQVQAILDQYLPHEDRPQ